MPQPPKFIISKDEEGEISWKLEAANADIASDCHGTFSTEEEAIENIRATIETTVAAAGVSISLGTEFNPVIEYVGFGATTPGPEEPYAEQTTEDQPNGQDQTAEPQDEAPEEPEDEVG